MTAEREWISIEIVAQYYGVDIEWLLRVLASGVVHGFQQRDDRLRIAAYELDRIAAAVRWHRHLDVDLETVVAMLLQGEEPRPGA